MKVYEYQRVSTSRQNEEQQHNAVADYCTANNLKVHKTVTDSGVSGGVSYKDRSLASLLEEMSEGDMLIVSEISRLGRSMSDLSRLVSEDLKPRKLRLVAVKNGIRLDCTKMTAVDEFIINALAFCSQIEKEMLRQRVASKMEVIKADIANGGYVVQKGKRKGQAITKLGNPDVVASGAAEKGNIASRLAKKEKAKANPNNALFAKLAKTWSEGKAPLTASTCGPFVKLLNEWGAKTSSGLDFTEKRCWAMYTSLKRQGILQ